MDLGKHYLGFQVQSALWFHMHDGFENTWFFAKTLPMLAFPYSHCRGKSSPKVPASSLCSCLNPSRSEPQQDVCSLSLDKDQEEEQSEEGDSPAVSLQGTHSNVLTVKTASKANACVSSSHFALGSMRIQMCLAKQSSLMPCRTPAAPFFILSWQTCPLNAEQDLRSCHPASSFIR